MKKHYFIFLVSILFFAYITATFLILRMWVLQNLFLQILLLPFAIYYLLQVLKIEDLEKQVVLKDFVYASLVSQIYIVVLIFTNTLFVSMLVFALILGLHLYIGSKIFALKKEKLAIESASLNKKQVFVVAVLFVLSFFAFFVFSKSHIGNDEGSYIYESILVMSGKVPIRDFISRAPAEIYLLAGFMKVFGTSVLSLKVFNALTLIGILYFAYAILCRYQKRSTALFCTFFIFLNPLFFIGKMIISTSALSLLFVLAAIYFLQKEKSWADFVSGALLCLAIFTRETTLMYAGVLLIYLLYVKQFRRLPALSGGFVVMLLPILAIFMPAIGVEGIFQSLLGVGHLKVQETPTPYIYSLSLFFIAFMAILPILVLRKILPKTEPSEKLYPLNIWVALMLVFYFLYGLKRGFLLPYASELMVPIFLLLFARMRVLAKSFVFNLFLISTLCLYLFISLTPIPDYSLDNRTGVEKLVGSIVPFSNFQKINAVIRQNSNPQDTILAGNLAFVTENNRKQFLDITRPLAYEGSSTVYSLYNVAPPQDVAHSFFNDPPRIVVLDLHLQISLWQYIQNFVETRYFIAYQDDYVKVYALTK